MTKEILISGLIEGVDELNLENRKELLKFVDDLDIRICENADGSRVNLDKISKHKLKLVLNKMNKLLEKEKRKD